MPSRTTACHTCKIRRIKCDGIKPTCHRCTKSGRLCVDAEIARQALFSIHVENIYASGKSKRPRGPRSSLVVLQQPQIDLKTKALTYYLQYHFQKSNSIVKVRSGLSESITIWLSTRKACPMVDLALSAIALAIFSRTQSYPPAASESTTCYSKLLRIVQQRISDFHSVESDGTDIDACLLTVSIMGRYEGIFPLTAGSKKPLGKLQAWAHHNGAMAVLKYWSDNFSHNGPTPFTKRIRREIIKHCLLRGIPLPDWSLNGSKFGEHGLELDYDCILTRVVNLHQVSKALQHETSYEMQMLKALALSYEIQHLDEALQAWAVKFGAYCNFEGRSLSSDDGLFPRLHFHSQKVYIYPSQAHAGAWCDYLGTAMLITAIRLRLLSITRLCRMTGFAHAQQQERCFKRLEELAGSIAATVPFCLGRVKIYEGSSLITAQETTDIMPYQSTFVVWALTVGACLDGVDIKQQDWFRAELVNMGKISGEAVLEYAATDRVGIL